MKKLFIYIALSVYTFAQLKPLAVVVEDVLAHTFWKVQHMATVHYENGHYHVHAELSDLSEKEQKNSQEKPNDTYKILESTFQEHDKTEIIFPSTAMIISNGRKSSPGLLSGFTTLNTQPPDQA